MIWTGSTSSRFEKHTFLFPESYDCGDTTHAAFSHVVSPNKWLCAVCSEQRFIDNLFRSTFSLQVPNFFPEVSTYFATKIKLVIIFSGTSNEKNSTVWIILP